MAILTQNIQIRDPFVLPLAEQGQYYLYGSTDKNIWQGQAQGFDCYTSKDLQNWEGPFPVFRPPTDFWADQNFWAPEVYHYRGRFYMFASFKANGKCRATQVLVSDRPEGPFVPNGDGKPLTPSDWECLDGTLFVDDSGQAWMVFCHEWLQVGDGKICAIRLSPELDRATDSPLLLFTASQAPWTVGQKYDVIEPGGQSFITDGPFMYRASNGELLMLWSSHTAGGYGMGIARSQSGNIQGPWMHDPKPLYSKDGGHGMLFNIFEGQLMLSLHRPNTTPNERPYFYRLVQM